MTQPAEPANSDNFTAAAEHIRANVQTFIEVYMSDRVKRSGLPSDMSISVSVAVQADDTEYPYAGTYVKKRASFPCTISFEHPTWGGESETIRTCAEHASSVLRSNICGMLGVLENVDDSLRAQGWLEEVALTTAVLAFKCAIVSDVKYTTESSEVLDLYAAREAFRDALRVHKPTESAVSVSEIGFTPTAANMCIAGHELLTTLLYKARFKTRLEHKLQGYAAVLDANKRVSYAVAALGSRARRAASVLSRVDVYAGDAKLTQVKQDPETVLGDPNLFHIAVPVHFRTKKVEAT